MRSLKKINQIIKPHKITLSHYMPKTPVAYYVYPTELGNVVLMTTANGICGLHFLAMPLHYYIALAEKKFKIGLHRNQAATQEWWYMLHEQSEPVPLAVIATPFQRCVWEILCTIPLGVQRTYAKIAQAIGRPNSSRAVGNAVSQNYFFYLIPCHRVVPANGNLGGYRWGAPLKKTLLTLERKQQRKVA